MQLAPAPPFRDALVEIRGQRWRVVSLVTHPDCEACHTTGADAGNSGIQRTFLIPFDRIHGQPPRRVRLVRPRRWWRTIRRELIAQRPFAGLDALAAASIDLLPYQLEPAIAMLRHGHLRMMIADGVGLGKTIQAAAIVAQIGSDEPEARTLVVCPAGLREQWRTEFHSRFGIRAVACDAEWLTQSGRTLPPAANPWSLPGVHITSLDLVKRPEVLRLLEDVTWDLGVFDEAHLLAPATDRLAAATTLARRMRRVLMLTATPPDGDPIAMRALVAVGRSSSQADVIVFRRNRQQLGDHRPRRTVFRGLDLTAAERVMHERVDGYANRLQRAAAASGDSPARLLAILLKKRALSSAASLLASVDRRLALLGSAPAGPSQLQLAFDDDEAARDDDDLDLLGTAVLADAAEELRLLSGVRAAAQDAVPSETKVRFVGRFLERVDESAIVFTEYRDTLARLRDGLTHRRPLWLHGGMSLPERDAVQREFCARGGLLLATDAASEGLNLHTHCRLVIHFEVPWNPLRLEQRVGRVERIGQKQRVHEILLVARHTAERLVLGPLMRRLRAATDVAGFNPRQALPESEVAGMVLDGARPADRPAEPVPHARSGKWDAEAKTEMARLAVLRKANLRAIHTSPDIVITGDLRGSSTVLVVVRVTGAAAGRGLGSFVLPLVLDAVPGFASLDTVADAIAATSKAVERFVSHYLRAVVPPWAGWHTYRTALLERELDLLHLSRQRSSQLVQAGLFDRRAVRDAETARGIREVLDDDAQRRITALSSDQVGIHIDILAVRAGAWPLR